MVFYPLEHFWGNIYPTLTSYSKVTFVDPSESTVDSIRNREAEMITRKLMHSWLKNISWVEKDKCTTKCMNRKWESRLLSIQEHLNTRGKTITRKNIVRFLECNLCIETKINIKSSLFFPLVRFCLFLCLFGLFIYLFFADFFSLLVRLRCWAMELNINMHLSKMLTRKVTSINSRLDPMKSDLRHLMSKSILYNKKGEIEI